MKRALCAALGALTAACSTIGHDKVQGWPQLQVVEHYVPYEVMLTRCRKYVGFGMTPLACAEFDFAGGRCLLWFNRDFAPETIVDHERLHCKGYDHSGDTTMRDILAKHYQKNRDVPYFSGRLAKEK